MSDTFFAPAERENLDIIKERTEGISNSGNIQFILNAIPEVAAILNKERQIIFSNNSLLNFLGVLDQNGIIGLRPGEALNCVNSDLTKAGCGTSENCKYCGAVNAILESQEKMISVTKECRITTKKDDTHEYLDLKVTSTPFQFKENTYSILSIDDISDYKRRKILEKIFFHDIINLTGGLTGFVELLKDTTDPKEINNYIGVVDKLSNEILEEIIYQRTLSSAENNDLEVKTDYFNSAIMLKEAAQYIEQHAIARNKAIIIDQNIANIDLNSDETLLKRVIINMLKNALEATDKFSSVNLNSYIEDKMIIFSVTNKGVIPRDIQLQIFQRSFSTKGVNRGLGTYSIKLLTERYLNGKVSFISTPENGTTFYIKIPLE